MDAVSVLVAAAKAASIPPALLLSVCFAETNLRNTITPADGGSASYGVCQVKLSTARLFNKRAHPSSLMRMEANAHYAALYLARQLKRYGGDVCRAVTAFNRGKALAFDRVNANCHTSYTRKVFAILKDEKWKRN